MSYAKALEGFLRLFPKKINVTWLHVNGELVGESKMFASDLPGKFDKPIILEGMGKKWRVVEADPVKADDFHFTKKLKLRVQDPGVADGRHYTPTAPAQLPHLVEEQVNDFFVKVERCDWRQIEFLPIFLLPAIEQEMSIIYDIIHPGKGKSNLTGYRTTHIRSLITQDNNKISFDDFISKMDTLQVGKICFEEERSVVKNGFSLRSSNYDFYGTVTGGVIGDLCLKHFESVDDELMQILKTFDLVLVDWCRGSMIFGEVLADESEVAGVDTNSMAADALGL